VTPVISFHPGGEKLLTFWAGRQADDIFTLIHGGSYDVMAMLHELEIGKLAPAAIDETLAMWERRLDRILEMQNDLTNNSRFEQIPTGCPAQLPSAPPVDAIRGSSSLQPGLASCLTRDSQSKLTRPCLWRLCAVFGSSSTSIKPASIMKSSIRSIAVPWLFALYSKHS
jgi:hypothetical protein